MKRRLTFARGVFALGAVTLGTLLAGCGGGGNSGSPLPSLAAPTTAAPSGTGQARFAILWPVRPASHALSPKLIPAASNSIVVTLQLGTSAPQSQTLTRPSGGSATTTATFTNLPVGTYAVIATAFPNANGTGVAQAAAAMPVQIVAGQTAALSLTMASTIASITVAPNPASVFVGQTVQLSATAFDGPNGTGNVVLTSAFAWTSGNTAQATVNPTTGLVTGIAATPTDPPAPVQITATDPESHVRGVGSVTVGLYVAAIFGSVSDVTTQAGIPGATVTFTSSAGSVVSTTTDSGGNYSSGPLRPDAAYTITASAPDYQSSSVQASLAPGQTLGPQAIPLRYLLGGVSGAVTNQRSRAAVPGATVTLTPTGGGAPIVLTAGIYSGVYSSSAVPVGTYSAVASAPGFNSSAPVTVTIQSHQNVTQNFQLLVYAIG